MTFVLTFLGPDMAAGEICATLATYLAGTVIALRTWPPPPRPHSVRKAAKVMAGRRALRARCAT